MPIRRNLKRYEAKYRSQHGEDGVIARLFQLIGTTTRYFVEIGVEAGSECNTRWLRENGWHGIMVDRDYADPTLPIYREFVTAENVNCVFAKHGVPRSFDLLSIDIDGNDYWVWQRLSRAYYPRVVIVEFNAAIPVNVSVAMPYAPNFRWRGESNIGQSLLAAKRLGNRKGYALVYAEPPTAYFVACRELRGGLKEMSAAEALGMDSEELHRGQLDRWRAQLRWLPWSTV